MNPEAAHINGQPSHDNDFQNIVDISPFPILIHKMGAIRYLNSLCVEMFEADNEQQIEGHNLLEFIHPEDRQSVIDAITQGASLNVRNAIIAARVMGLKGGTILTETKSSTITFRGEQCRMVVAYNYDHMTRVERELKEKELLLQKMAETMPDFVIMVDPQTKKIVFENRSLIEALGYSKADVQGDWMGFGSKIVHPDDFLQLIQLRDFLNNPANENNFITIEYRVLDKAGKWHWLLNRSTILRASERPLRYLNFGIAQDITAIKEIEEQLRETKNFSEKIAQLVPDSMIVVESKTRKVLFENKSLMEVLGYSEEDFAGKEDMFDFMQNIIHREDRKKLLESRKFLFDPANAGQFISTEYRMLDKAGKWRWILGRSTNLSVNNDQQVNFGIAQDITPLKDIENELRESRNFNEKIARTIPNHVSIFDIRTNEIIYHNFFFGELLDYSPDERLSNMFDYFDPEHLSIAQQRWAQVPLLKDGEIFTSVDIGRSKTGKRKYLLSRLTPFSRGEDGHIKQVLSTTIDITDLKEAEFKLKASEQARQAVLDALPDVVFQVNRRGVVTNFYSEEPLLKQLEDIRIIDATTRVLLPYDEYGSMVDLIAAAIDNDDVQAYEYIRRRDEERFYYEFRIVRLNREEAIVVVRDVTLLRKAQLQLDIQLGELSTKNRELERYITSNTELEKFAYIASHDLREPVRSIVGFAQLLQRRNAAQLDAESKEFLENIIDSAQRMNALIHGLLDYSRIGSTGKPFEQTDLNEVLKKVRNDIKVSVEESGADIISDTLPVLQVDELQIRQLFQNLISNSIKFKHDNVKPVVKVFAENQGDRWLFRIEDNGIGLDMKYKQKVFQLFNRLHAGDKYQGSGIGLALCKRIVERHKGEIWLESNPGKGTTFYFTLSAEV
ncbi:MAG: PAS domain S-box protein [Chitinophagales bacterium]